MAHVGSNTWAQLPAVTLPLPVPGPEAPSEPQHIAPYSATTLPPQDGARWSWWGAAREGARTTLQRHQIAALLVILALAAWLSFVSPQRLTVGALFLVVTAYLAAGTYKLGLLLRGERAANATTACPSLPPLVLSDGDL